jgi:hypothetical protein
LWLVYPLSSLSAITFSFSAHHVVFCIDNNYENGILVTEAKLLGFLDEVVAPRGNLRKRTTDPNEVRELRLESIQHYIKAVVDPHASQASRSLVAEPTGTDFGFGRR